MENKRVLLVINPRAGQMTFKNSLYTVAKKISDAGCSLGIHFTTEKNDAANTVGRIGENYDLIVACGGDGTFNETVNGALKLKKPVQIGYIPCGSTNDFASTLGIAGGPSKIVDNILAERFVTLDLGKFNDRYFTYTASFGIFTSTSYDTPQNMKNALGHVAYLLSAFKQLSNVPRIPMHVDVDGYSEEGVYYYGGVSNTTSIGGFYTLPENEVKLNDGQLELLMIREPKAPQELSQTLFNLAIRDFDDPNILFMHGKEFVFTSPEEVPFTLDGEFGGAAQKNVILCAPKAISVNGKLS